MAYRGYCARKSTFFYGLKLHLVVTATGVPVEFGRSPGAMSDLHGLRTLALNLGPSAELIVDKGYCVRECPSRRRGHPAVPPAAQRCQAARTRLGAIPELG